MLVCVSCNIEFKEDKKFCSYCGGALVVKEDLVPDKKKPEKEEDKSEQRLTCPICKTVYEFGSSCIQCGSDLVTETHPAGKEGLEADHQRPEPQEKIPASDELVCSTCKIVYKDGNFCPKCGSPLFPQMLTQATEEAKPGFILKAGEGLIPPHSTQEHNIETPRKNLVCPHCKIIYERGSTCVRCGSPLMGGLPAEQTGTPEPSGTPEHALDSSIQHKALTGSVQASEPKGPSPSSPKSRDGGPGRDGLRRQSERMEHEELELLSDIETNRTPGVSKQEPTKSADNLERRSFGLRKRKIDSRRLFLEVGSILIMVLAGGYLVWSIYSHVAKLSESKDSRPKEVSVPAHSNSPNPLGVAAEVPVPEESEKAEPQRRSVISNEKTEATPSSGSPSSDASVTEALEIGKIKDLLEHIRQANLQKDVDLFMSCYAMDFKDREGKKKAMLSFWKKFDYLELSYDLKKTWITGDTARVKIEWVIKISPKGGHQPQESKTFFDAIIKKEEGGWKILEVKQAG